jgi:hypothetical protein
VEWIGRTAEISKDLAGDEAFEAANDLGLALSLGDAMRCLT